jgi:hypothetical protein
VVVIEGDRQAGHAVGTATAAVLLDRSPPVPKVDESA